MKEAVIKMNSFQMMKLLLAALSLAVTLSLAGCRSHEAASHDPAAHNPDSHNNQPATTPATAPTAASVMTDPTPRVPHFHASTEAAKPFPKTLPPEQFHDPGAVRAYTIAQRIPDVLSQQPCYCYCDQGLGHKSLLDCHADTHSAECLVCLKETLLADKLNREGKSASQIREAIERGEWREVPVPTQ